MARLFTTGFERGDYLDWDEQIASGYMNLNFPHTGTYGVFFQSYGNIGLVKNVSPSPSDELCSRVWFKTRLADGRPGTWIIRHVMSDDTFCGLYYKKSDMTLYAYVGSSTTVDSYYVGAVDFEQQWHMFEMYTKIADSGGAIQVKKGGTLILDYEGDTQPGTSSEITEFWLYGQCAGVDYCNYDDIGVNDMSGSVDNGWPGDGRVIAIKPNASGDITQWTPLAGISYENVDDIPHDSDTTYNYTSGSGNVDTFEMGNPSLSGYAILGIEVKGTAKELTADGDQVRAVLRTGGANFTGDDFPVGTNYSAFSGAWRTNPDTSGSWTTSEVDSLQVGYESRPA